MKRTDDIIDTRTKHKSGPNSSDSLQQYIIPYTTETHSMFPSTNVMRYKSVCKYSDVALVTYLS